MIEVKSVAGGLRLEGYASLFGVRDLAGDVVMPGAFGAARRFLPMLFNHDPDARIGAWSAAEEDGRGLYVKGFLSTGDPAGRAAAALIRVGALDGLSIGYRTRAASLRPGGGRALHRVDLVEVSVVTFPMLPQARLAAAFPSPTAPTARRPM